MRLIEMIAVAIYQIAVMLYQLNLGVHTDDEIGKWPPPETDFIGNFVLPCRPRFSSIDGTNTQTSIQTAWLIR